MGNNANQNDIAPNNTLASVVYAWGPMYVQMIKESVAGTYGNKQYWINFANDGIKIIWNDALMGKVKPEILEKMNKAQEELAKGTLNLGDLDKMKLQ